MRTPVWQNPDEPAHYNYVRWIASTATLPELQQGDWDSALLSRLQNGRLSPSDSVSSIRYESWQPPGYYLLATPVFVVGPADDAARVLRLRLFGVLLGALTLVAAYMVARLLLPEQLVPAVPLTMAGVPMFTAVSASVSADPLANLLAALLLLALLRRTDWRLLGLLLGLGLITKLALAIFVPLVLWRSRKALALAAAVTVPWLFHQVTTYGWTDPMALARHAQVVADQPRFPGLSPDYAWQFVTVSFHSFWAQFGWMAIPAPDWLYWLWGLLSLLALLGLVLQRASLRGGEWQLLLATIALALVAYVAYNLTFQQFQSRYVFTALVPITSFLVRGWAPQHRWGMLTAYGGAALLVALNGYALLRVMLPGFSSAT